MTSKKLSHTTLMISASLFFAPYAPSVAETNSENAFSQKQFLPAFERQCLFGHIRSENCDTRLEALAKRAGFTGGQADIAVFNDKLCKIIDGTLNYTAKGNKNGFGIGGGLGFDAGMSVRTTIGPDGNCSIILGEYGGGYEPFYTSDYKEECTRYTTFELMGESLVTFSRLFNCSEKKYMSSEEELIRKEIGRLRSGRELNADYVIPEIPLPQH